MNILFDSYNCIMKNPSGGVQNRVRNLQKSIERQSINVSLFSKWSKPKNIDIYHLFKILHESYDIVRYMADQKIPIVVSSVMQLNIGLKYKCRIWFSKKTHGALYYNSEIMHIANHIIAQTQREKNYIVEYYGIQSEKITVIPNGVSDSFGCGDPQIFADKFNITAPYILQVGSIENNKNQLSVIRALKGSGIPVIFIGGENVAEKDYYRLCKEESDENFIFTGWIKDIELICSAYAGAQTVVLPSFHEIFGNSLIEGARAGANIVSTDVLPIDEWGLNDSCLKVVPASVADIREKLMASYNKNGRCEELKQIIKETFSWEKVANDYIDVYRKIMQ